MADTIARAARLPLTWLMLLAVAAALLLLSAERTGGALPSVPFNGTLSGNTSVAKDKGFDCKDVPKEEKKDCKVSKG
jgi:hypothetical protein